MQMQQKSMTKDLFCYFRCYKMRLAILLKQRAFSGGENADPIAAVSLFTAPARSPAFPLRSPLLSPQSGEKASIPPSAKKSPRLAAGALLGGEKGIRTLARVLPGYRISSADPSTSWVSLHDRIIISETSRKSKYYSRVPAGRIPAFRPVVDASQPLAAPR